MNIEKEKSAENIETELGREREMFAENLRHLAENIEALPGFDEASVSGGELKERMKRFRDFFGNKDNVLALAVVVGNVGTGLSDTLASPYLASSYEILKNDPLLRDTIKALGVEEVVGAFRNKLPEIGSKIDNAIKTAFRAHE